MSNGTTVSNHISEFLNGLSLIVTQIMAATSGNHIFNKCRRAFDELFRQQVLISRSACDIPLLNFS